MATLNDTARTILSAAASRDDLRALPLPGALRAPPHIVRNTLTRMIEAGLLAELTALPEDAVWVESEAGGRVTLVATPAGLAALGIEPAEAAPAQATSGEAPTRRKGHSGGSKPTKGAKAPPRGATGDGGAKQSKQAAVLALLRRLEGASVAEMMTATGWQAHSVRGFMSGALKKRLGIEVVSEKGKTGERRYYIAPIKQADPS